MSWREDMHYIAPWRMKKIQDILCQECKTVYEEHRRAMWRRYGVVLAIVLLACVVTGGIYYGIQ